MARKVLIADDSPTVQKKASGILTGEGLEVVTVSNGVAAIKKLPTVKPLVVLADVAMPGKDGYEVCEFVKNSADLKSVPVILVFSDTDPLEEPRAARAQADGRIKKPFDHDELVATVSKFLAMAEAGAAKPKAAPPAVAAPSRPAVVTEPVDEEPQVAARPAVPDFSSLAGGVAFAEPTALEERAAPLPEAAPIEPVTAAEAPTPSLEAAPTLAESRPVSEPEPATAAPEPVLVEESAPAEPHEPEPAPERTMLFRAPSEIAEPVLSDELTPAPPAPLPYAQELATQGPPAPIESEPPAVAATTLESFSLKDAASGQVRFAAPEEAPVQTEPVPTIPAAPRSLDPGQVFAIVHKVVVKMSPPALSPQIIEDMAKRFTDEIAAELNLEA